MSERRRNLLHKSRLPEFRDWLEARGNTILPCKGAYEVLRWKNDPGVPMAIVFDRLDATQHLTTNKEATTYVRMWLRERETGHDDHE